MFGLSQHIGCCEVRIRCLVGEHNDLTRARESYENALTAGVRKKVPELLLNLVIRDDESRAFALLKEYPDLWSENAVWMDADKMLCGRSAFHGR